MNIYVYKKKVRGDEKWCVDREEGGRRRQTFWPNKLAADNEATKLRGGVADAKGEYASLTLKDREQIALAWRNAQDQGHDLHDLISRAGELKPHAGPTVGITVNEVVSAKRAAGRDDRYTDNLATVLGKFAKGRESVKMDAVSLRDVESFLNAHSIAYRSTLRTRLSILFNFAIRRGYRADNPCARLESVKVTKKPPAIFTVKQFQKCVEALSKPFKPSKHSPQVDYRHGLAWFALTTLCGLRPEEAEKTTKKDIHFKEGWIRVEAQTTKVRQRRVVYPKPEALKFLQWAKKRGGRLPLNSQAKKRVIHHLRDALGFKAWPKDITRHTAASYWLASDGSAAHVSEMLGNSERVLKRDYKALVTREEAKEFWALLKTYSHSRDEHSHKMAKKVRF